MTDRQQIIKLIENVDKELLKIVLPLIDELEFIEKQIEETKKHKFLLSNKKGETIETSANKTYFKFIDRKIAIRKFLISIIAGQTDAGEDMVTKIFKEKFGG